MQQASALIQVNPQEPIRLFACNVLGHRTEGVQVKEDRVSTDLAKVDLVKDVRLVDFDHWAKGDSIAEHLEAMKKVSTRELPLNPRHADYIFNNPGCFPDSWKGSVGNRVYVGFPGAVIRSVGSAEPLVVVLWWNGFSISRSYASRAGENRQSKFYFAMFTGNPFAAK